MTKLGAFDSYVQDNMEKHWLQKHSEYKAHGGQLDFTEWQEYLEFQGHEPSVQEEKEEPEPDTYDKEVFDSFNKRDYP